MPENYSFVSRGNDKWASIVITKGKYTGIIYQYGRVSVAEKENEDGNLPLSFDYNILDYNNLKEEDIHSSVYFKNCFKLSPNCLHLPSHGIMFTLLDIHFTFHRGQ